MSQPTRIIAIGMNNQNNQVDGDSEENSNSSNDDINEKGFFDIEYVLCYKRNLYSNDWNCKETWPSMKKINTRINELLMTNSSTAIQCFSFCKITPNFIRKPYIMYHLRPNIDIDPDPIPELDPNNPFCPVIH